MTTKSDSVWINILKKDEIFEVEIENYENADECLKKKRKTQKMDSVFLEWVLVLEVISQTQAKDTDCARTASLEGLDTKWSLRRKSIDISGNPRWQFFLLRFPRRKLGFKIGSVLPVVMLHAGLHRDDLHMHRLHTLHLRRHQNGPVDDLVARFRHRFTVDTTMKKRKRTINRKLQPINEKFWTNKLNRINWRKKLNKSTLPILEWIRWSRPVKIIAINGEKRKFRTNFDNLVELNKGIRLID